LGANALNESEKIMKTLGKKAFVVTDKIIAKTDAFALLADTLAAWGIAWEVYSDITGEPTDTMILAGIAACKKAGSDFLIAIGGGSALDSAKAISAMCRLEGTLADYMGKEMQGDFMPTVAIPTTAGTGSEATKFTIITDTAKDVKMLLKGDALIPTVAIVDPAFTLSAPKSITAATGMDALTHAVESYTSKKGNSMTDIFALDAIKRIFAYLPEAYGNGGNQKAREEMSIAAYEAGVCINNASVTLVHGMSRPIGALFHVPHGISNAMLIGECLDFAVDGCPHKFAALAKLIGVTDENTDDSKAAAAFMEALEGLCKQLEIPTLKEYGIKKDEYDSVIPKMAKDAMASGSPSNTVKEITAQDIEAIYKRLYK
jgi:alcohol dehydrogenase class IV